MADIRIKVAKDKANLVKALRAGEGLTGPFQTYVDLMIFAASLGIRNKKYMPIETFSRKDPDPIPLEHFESRGQSQIIDLIAISHIKDPIVLGKDEVWTLRRVEYFENYANGGLCIIEDGFKSMDTLIGHIQLLLAQEKNLFTFEEESIDLSFLST